MKKFLDNFALIVSAVASPFITVTLFSLFFIYRYSKSLSEFALWGGSFVTFLVLIPLAVIFYEVKTGKITDIHIAVRQQRTMPFMLCLVSAIALIASFKIFDAPGVILMMLYAMVINGIVFLLITQFWKISIHSAALSGAIVMSAFFINTQLILLLLIIPLVAWARMRRHRHNIWQSIAATAVSFLTTIIFISITT